MQISKKIVHNNPVFIGLASLILIFLLTGCEEKTIEETVSKNENKINTEETNSISNPENIDDASNTVTVFHVKNEDNSSTLPISGTITANEEVTVSAEASGIVSEVWKKEGEKVENGERIMMLDAGNNLALSAYNSATIAKSHAATSLNLYKQSAQTEIENAVISSEQAQITLEQVKRTQNSEKKSITSQIENAKSQENLSKKNLEISETSLKQMIENEEKIQKNILENTGNTLSKTLVNFRSSMNMADELLGASAINKKKNDEFAVYLEGTTIGVMLPTQDLWRQTDPQIQEVETLFRNFEKESYSLEDEESMTQISQTTIQNAKSLRKILRNIETMLKESISSPSFPQSKIDTLKAQIIQHQNTLEANLSQLTISDQALSDFHLKSPQRITNSELQVAVANAQYSSAQQNFETLKSSGNTNSIKVISSLEQAKTTYRSAKNAVESAKIKTEISIQGARAQYNSANAQLAQSEITLSKLTIRSGIKGTITKVFKKDGDSVSMGTPIVVIADYSSLKLKGDVSISNRLKIKEGMRANIIVEEIDEVFSGTVSLISPEANKITKRVALEITLPNTINIPANIFATAEIVLEEENNNKIFIPTSSVLNEHDKHFVYIAEKNTETEKCKNSSKEICYILRKKEVELETTSETLNIEVLQIKSGIILDDNVIYDYSEILEKNIKEGDEIEFFL